jgi:hypothetical protein
MEKFQNFSPEAKALPDHFTDSPSTRAATVGVKFTSNSSGVTFTSRAFFPGRNKPKTKVEVISTGLAFSDGNSCDFQFLGPLSEVRCGKRRGEAR